MLRTKGVGRSGEPLLRVQIDADHEQVGAYQADYLTDAALREAVTAEFEAAGGRLDLDALLE